MDWLFLSFGVYNLVFFIFFFRCLELFSLLPFVQLMIRPDCSEEIYSLKSPTFLNIFHWNFSVLVFFVWKELQIEMKHCLFIQNRKKNHEFKITFFSIGSEIEIFVTFWNEKPSLHPHRQYQDTKHIIVWIHEHRLKKMETVLHKT